jgi:hypothetical protein
LHLVLEEYQKNALFVNANMWHEELNDAVKESFRNALKSVDVPSNLAFKQNTFPPKTCFRVLDGPQNSSAYCCICPNRKCSFCPTFPSDRVCVIWKKLKIWLWVINREFFSILGCYADLIGSYLMIFRDCL